MEDICPKCGRSYTTKTKKEQRPIVLYDATDKHPAQTQLITEDVSIGTWKTVKQSGAIPVPRKKVLLERVDKLLKAVLVAREQANSVEATDECVGAAIMGYLTRE